ncbi:MAG: hypothetical protein ACYCX3_15990, partial [Thermoleophilia bacterium]
ELAQMQAMLEGFEVLGSLPYSAGVRQADLDEAPPFERAPEYVSAVRGIVEQVRISLEPAVEAAD